MFSKPVVIPSSQINESNFSLLYVLYSGRIFIVSPLLAQKTGNSLTQTENLPSSQMI
jgi:hypothetical protein